MLCLMQAVNGTLVSVPVTEISLGMLDWLSTSPEVSVQFKTHSRLANLPSYLRFPRSSFGDKD